MHKAKRRFSAALATLDLHEREGLAQRAAELAPYWEECVHALRGLPGVIDIRNFGLIAALEYALDHKHTALKLISDNGGSAHKRWAWLALERKRFQLLARRVANLSRSGPVARKI